MEQQLDLFSSMQLRDIGIKKAVDNANDHCESWSKKAYKFLVHYSKTNSEFMAEHLRDLLIEISARRDWWWDRLKINRTFGFGWNRRGYRVHTEAYDNLKGTNNA